MRERMTFKQMLASILAAVMLFTMLPAESLTVFATEPTTQSASGDADDASNTLPQNSSASGITIVGINGQEYFYDLAAGTSFRFQDICGRMLYTWPQFFGYTDGNGTHHVANTTVGCDYDADGEIDQYYNSDEYIQSQGGMKIYLQSEEAYALTIHNFRNVASSTQKVYVPKDNGAISLGLNNIIDKSLLKITG